MALVIRSLKCMTSGIFTLILALMLNVTTVSVAQLGNALYLDGDGDFMRVKHHQDFNVLAGKSLTITCQVKTSVVDDFRRIVSKRSGTMSTNPGYEMFIKSGTGEFGVNLRMSNGVNAGPPYSAVKINDDKWHHLAMVIDADMKKIQTYIDGSLQQTGSNAAIGTQDAYNLTDILVGAGSGPGFFWNGWIDDVRIYRNALTADQITKDITTAPDAGVTNLIAAWDFEKIDGIFVQDTKSTHPGTLTEGCKILPVDPFTMRLLEVTDYYPDAPLGKNNADERLASAVIKTTGAVNPLLLDSLCFIVSGNMSPASLKDLQLYYTGSQKRFKKSWAQKIASGKIYGDTIKVGIQHYLKEGDNYFWLTTAFDSIAREGDSLACTLTGYRFTGNDYVPFETQKSPWLRPLLLEHQLLFSGGDYQSGSYRIPAIVSRGDTLVVAADARILSNADLPNNIDLYARTSFDKGKTWTEPITIANFGNDGASDPALVADPLTGDILCLFASHAGLFQSTPSQKIKFQVARSKDNGLSWSAPQDFSDDIYLSGWYAAWIASGNAHAAADSQLFAVAGVRENESTRISNFLITSKDGGQSWESIPVQANPVGDEAKIISLETGELMMLIRAPGKRKVTFSNDKGQSWSPVKLVPELVEPGVNGDLLRYTSLSAGQDKNRILFSIPNHPTQRKNLTLFMSYDEGKSWSVKKVIYPGLAAYSSLAILKDGSIGIFYENGEYENYELYFARFSLDWFTNGEDTFGPPSYTDNPETDLIDLRLIPNPANQTATIQYSLPGKITGKVIIDLISQDGRIVQSQLTGSDTADHPGTATIDIINMHSGIYYLRLRVGKYQKTEKLIIQH